MLCYLNDRFLPYEEATVHVSDLALHRGYGVFDYLREIDGKVPFLEDYFDRFYNSAKELGLEVPVGRDRLKEIIFHLISEHQYKSSGIKLILTGGYTEDYYRPVKPNFLILNVPFKSYPKEYLEGVKLMLFEHQRFLPHIKTINYIPALWLLPKLTANNALEPLYHFNGKVLETSRGNVFFIKEKTIFTPKDDILLGVSRKHLLRIARESYTVEERDAHLEEIENAEEIFITGTSKHVLPIIQIDDIVIGDGRPGPVTLELMKAFEGYISEV
jgi:D-alanine transaminase/branched-chain amino acid aminotransferase